MNIYSILLLLLLSYFWAVCDGEWTTDRILTPFKSSWGKLEDIADIDVGRTGDVSCSRMHSKFMHERYIIDIESVSVTFLLGFFSFIFFIIYLFIYLFIHSFFFHFFFFLVANCRRHLLTSTLNGRNERKLFKRIRFEIASNWNIEGETKQQQQQQQTKKKSNQSKLKKKKKKKKISSMMNETKIEPTKKPKSTESTDKT